MNNKGKNFTVN